MDRDLQPDRQAQRQALSAMLDGDALDAERACRAWREEAQSRDDWYVYHVIGEVMRSDETVSAPQHDAQFLGRLRERLVQEPVVLAPAAAASAVRTTWARRAWAAPVAVAAGFLAVVGVVVVAGVGVPQGASLDRSARAEGLLISSGVASLQSVNAAASAAPAAAGDGVLIRDAELDRDLAAHKQYSSTSALAVPGGAVRNAAATAPGR